MDYNTLQEYSNSLPIRIFQKGLEGIATGVGLVIVSPVVLAALANAAYEEITRKPLEPGFMDYH